ncbi:MAG TPA: LysM peptidoglycan-binding domain-containing protein [Bacteroidia bacterium]|jgi:nucleoid-associated protein YgaU|nr:LysM peptidoglycan-binding domain-containing protein [Bacteroidia bacterium]
MAAASLSGNKALAKLTIIPFAVKEKAGVPVTTLIPAGVPFVCMYNPTTFTKSNNTRSIPKPTTSNLPPKVEQKALENETVTFDILLDATGASPGSGVVGAALTKTAKTLGGVDLLIANFFLTTRQPNSSTHRPNTLRIIWGAGLYFECVLCSAKVSYSLFDRTGRPLRATINATFKQAPTSTFLSKIKNFFSSPDVTKTYVVKAGDTIYNLAQSEYGDESFYQQIAEVNDLKNYRKLVPGQVLIFPPIKQDEA